MLHWPFDPEQRRKRCLRKAPAGPLRDYLEVPLPRPGADYREVEYLAVDLETTGLDLRRDTILSFGYVVVRGGRIDLSQSHHCLVRSARAIPEASAVVHQITDDLAATGESLEQALGPFLRDLRGRVMIAHHARIERAMISAACRTVYGMVPPFRIVDTQVVAQRLFERRQIPYKPSELRLYALGERYNLPRYGAHNALSDALAAAELFLAQAAHRDGGKGVALRELLA